MNISNELKTGPGTWSKSVLIIGVIAAITAVKARATRIIQERKTKSWPTSTQF